MFPRDWLSACCFRWVHGHNLVYNTCWEDPRLDVQALQLGPRDRVAMGSQVTYEQLPDGARRTVTLVFPVDADAGNGRVSVLSPIGLALLGRARGTSVEAALPDGRRLRIRILSLERVPLKEAA